MKIGWSFADVTPEVGMDIPGQFYMRISKGTLDPVTVTCLLLEQDKEMAIFLTLDTVMCRMGLLDGIRDLVAAKKPEIPAEKILLSATHTHTAPAQVDDMVGEIPMDGIEMKPAADYFAFLIEKAAACVIEAYENRKVGGFAYGYGFATVGFQRRVAYFDDLSLRPGAVNNATHGVNGKVKMYGNTNDDNFSHFEGGADPFVNLMFTFDEKENLTGAIVNVPCPSQCSEKEYYYSADYWHNVRQMIREKYGDIFVLAQCAAAGDLAPRQLHYKAAKSRRYLLKYGNIETLAQDKERYIDRLESASRIVAAFDEVYSWAKQEIIYDAPLQHRVEEFILPRRAIDEKTYEEAKVGLAEVMAEPFATEGTPEENLTANTRLRSNRNRYRGIIEKYETNQKEPNMPMEAHIITLGPIAFASNQFELFQDFQHRIQARSPFIQTFVVQLAAQPGRRSGSYLPTERAMEGRGYGASIYDNLTDHRGGQIIVEQTLKALNEMHNG